MTQAGGMTGRDREGPWSADEMADVLPLVDFSGHSPWHGGPEPPPIAPAANPGGLVAVLLDRADHERARWPLTRQDPAAGVDEAAEACAGDAALRLVIYDGDHGGPVVVLKCG
jgi:hypothetical protein